MTCTMGITVEAVSMLSITSGRRHESGMPCDASPGSCCHDGTNTCLCEGHDVTGAFYNRSKVISQDTWQDASF